jgi:hypothetical protein
VVSGTNLGPQLMGQGQGVGKQSLQLKEWLGERTLLLLQQLGPASTAKMCVEETEGAPRHSYKMRRTMFLGKP